MAVTTETLQGCANQILGVLPDKELNRLSRSFDFINVTAGDVLYECDQPTNSVYFPLDAAISLITTMDDGRSVEVGLIGFEGALGVAGVLLDPCHCLDRAIIAVGGT